MRRVIFSVLALFVCVSAVADEQSKAALQRVARYVKSLGAYEVSYLLTSGEYAAKGYFQVEGDMYYMRVGGAEVYSDGKVRYEVDNERKEINIDNVSLDSHNILDNPTRCFDFVGSDYSIKSEAERGENITLRITPNDKEQVGIIRLVSDIKSGRPESLEYEMYDEKVKVQILSIGRSKEPMKRFRESDYGDYEIVDFR